MTDPLPHAIVVGASSAIGMALISLWQASGDYRVHAISRQSTASGADDQWLTDYSEDDLERIAAAIDEQPGQLARLVICNGILHGPNVRPERALKQLSAKAMLSVLEVNTVLPLMCLRAFTPLIKEAPSPRVAVLSARVGSIGDNGLGGWYSYRASKAALNMGLKCTAIEWARLNKRTGLMAFHPGTTDSPLSKPFQRGVPDDKLFTPGFVATRLVALLDALPASSELAYLDWDGKAIPW